MRRNRKRADRVDGMVVATIVLCFAMTLALGFFIGGDSIVSAVFRESTDGRTFYFICVDGGENRSMARETANVIKKKGGAGYLDIADGNKILLAVYPTEKGANDVLDALDYTGAYLVKKTSKKVKYGKDDNVIKGALTYIDVAFDGLYSLTNSVADGSISLQELNTQLNVLYAQIDEIKSVFYENTKNSDDEKITSLKLALVTCLALIDGVECGDSATALSSLRHQTIQLVNCYIALTNEID